MVFLPFGWISSDSAGSNSGLESDSILDLSFGSICISVSQMSGISSKCSSTGSVFSLNAGSFSSGSDNIFLQLISFSGLDSDSFLDLSLGSASTYFSGFLDFSSKCSSSELKISWTFDTWSFGGKFKSEILELLSNSSSELNKSLGGSVKLKFLLTLFLKLLFESPSVMGSDSGSVSKLKFDFVITGLVSTFKHSNFASLLLLLIMVLIRFSFLTFNSLKFSTNILQFEICWVSFWRILRLFLISSE